MEELKFITALTVYIVEQLSIFMFGAFTVTPTALMLIVWEFIFDCKFTKQKNTKKQPNLSVINLNYL